MQLVEAGKLDLDAPVYDLSRNASREAWSGMSPFGNILTHMSGLAEIVG
jgi:CubicO group peptidase (beta-lactamase class C family)